MAVSSTSLPPNTYRAVRVLMICWKDSPQQELRKQLQALETEFRAHAFDVEPVYEIESDCPQRTLTERVQAFLKHDLEETLLIVYYGGHGLNSKDKHNIWLCHDPAAIQYATNPKVDWTAVQTLFLDECKSHVLFLLDCCFAESAIQYVHSRSSVEAIVAAGADRVTPIRGKDSFTRVLRDIIRDCRTANDGRIYSGRLCSLISAKLNQTDWDSGTGHSARVTPRHLVFSNTQSSIYLAPLQREAIGERESISVAAQSSKLNSISGLAQAQTRFTGPRFDDNLDVGIDRAAKRKAFTSEDLELSATLSECSAQIDAQANDSDVQALKRQRRHESYLPQTHVPEILNRDGFTYERLFENCFRVFCLYPSREYSGPLVGTFKIQQVGPTGPAVPRSNEYIAVSHVWGRAEVDAKLGLVQVESSKGCTIGHIEVLPKLDRALRQLRRDFDQIYVWVDWLCINFKDSVEQEVQNAMMHRIFQHATEVTVWLGEGSDETRTAMQFVPQIVDLSRFDEHLKSSETPKQWIAVVKLLEGSWFSRRWVFPELVFASSAFVQCGAERVAWDVFRDAILLLGSQYEGIRSLCSSVATEEITTGDLQRIPDLRALSAYSVAVASRDLFQASSPGQARPLCTLQTLVANLSNLQTTLPQDFLYALLPLASDSATIDIARDYDTPRSHVFQNFIRSCAKSKCIDIICTPWAPDLQGSSPHIGAEQDELETWPSWICTIRNLPFGRQEGTMYGRTNGDTFIGLPNRRIYDTSHGSSAVPIFGTTSPTGEIVYDGSMTVSGFKIGTVSYTGDIAVGGLLPDSWVRLSGWKPWVRSVPDHFWRTLVADRGPEGIPTPPWYHLACLYWLDFLHKSREDYPSQSYNGLPSTAVNFILRMESVIWNRRLIVVKDISQQKSSGSAQANAQEEKQELFGLAPAVTQDNDCIVVLDGCSVPVVLRQRDDRWILVGECFVYGIMEGESMQMEEYLGRTQEFLLV